MYRIKLFILQTVGKIMKKLNRGSSIVGYLDEKLKFNVLKSIDFSDKQIIFVTGTNGKTSLTNNLNNILLNIDKKVLSNLEGANLVSGIKTIIIKNLNYQKKIDYDYFLFEVDEKTVGTLTKKISPNHIIMTNFFRDQLDRYFEIDAIIKEICDIIKEKKIKVYYNCQDVLLESYLQNIETEKVTFKLLEDNEATKNSNSLKEIKYCPNCIKKLKYKYYHFSHIGEFYCDNPECNFKMKEPDYVFKNNGNELVIIEKNDEIKIYEFNEQKPKYFILNLSLFTTFILENFPENKNDIVKQINSISSPKGRNNFYQINGGNIYLNLAKNVAGMEQTLRYIEQIKINKKINLLIAFNDNYADGRDVSWIWDVDFEKIIPHIDELHIIGNRRYDMKLRFLYAGFSNIQVYNNFDEGLKKILNGNNYYIISNYTPLKRIVKYVENYV